MTAGSSSASDVPRGWDWSSTLCLGPARCPWRPGAPSFMLTWRNWPLRSAASILSSIMEGVNFLAETSETKDSKPTPSKPATKLRTRDVTAEHQGEGRMLFLDPVKPKKPTK